MRLGGSFK